MAVWPAEGQSEEAFLARSELPVSSASGRPNCKWRAISSGGHLGFGRGQKGAPPRDVRSGREMTA